MSADPDLAEQAALAALLPYLGVDPDNTPIREGFRRALEVGGPAEVARIHGLFVTAGMVYGRGDVMNAADRIRVACMLLAEAARTGTTADIAVLRSAALVLLGEPEPPRAASDEEWAEEVEMMGATLDD